MQHEQDLAPHSYSHHHFLKLIQGEGENNLSTSMEPNSFLATFSVAVGLMIVFRTPVRESMLTRRW